MKQSARILALTFLVLACSKKDPAPPVATKPYFPSVTGTWETVTPASLGWNEAAITDLKTFLLNNNTRSLIVLKDGKIAIELYFNTQLNSTVAFTQSSIWYWASAGKTLTSSLVGIANGQGKINLDAKTSDYLGIGWTKLSPLQENKITVRHQLTMTTGLNDYSDPGATGNKDCTDPACLIYKADPGMRWAYHNAPYTLLDGVVASGTSQTLTNFFNTQLRDKIGMDGSYLKIDLNNVFFSTPRSMARFGLLLLNEGTWNDASIIPLTYFNLMKTTSQNLNLSYGYLTWLNGKASSMAPGSQVVFPVGICVNAPKDMFAAMGKNGQLINMVPSKGLVVIRMGDVPDNFLVPFNFQNDLWAKLNAVITN